MKQHGTRFTHCWASCEIAKACGQKPAEDWQDIKEWYDWGVCGVPGFSKNCDSAFQPEALNGPVPQERSNLLAGNDDDNVILPSSWRPPHPVMPTWIEKTWLSSTPDLPEPK